MTVAELNRQGRKIGNGVLFNLIMGVIILASAGVSVISDYVQVGFDFSFLASFSYWAKLLADNVINMAMAIVFRSIMRDREKKINSELNMYKTSIENIQKYVFDRGYNNALKAYVDERNAERKYKMYSEHLKNKANTSRAKKRMDAYTTKYEYEKRKAKPNRYRLEFYKEQIERNKTKYESILSKLETAKEDCAWVKVRGYKPIRTEVLFSTADKIRDNNAENYEVNNAREFIYFFMKKIVFVLLFATFLGTLVPQGFEFNYTLLWSTANKIFWAAMSLYAGGSSGVEMVQQVLIPAVSGRTSFLGQFKETIEKNENTLLQISKN